MKRATIFAVALTCCAAATSFAQEATRSFDFKGVRPGDTAIMHVGKWGNDYKQPPCQVGGGRFGLNTMYCDFADQYVSGLKTHPSAGFEINGKLREVSGSGDIDNLDIYYKSFVQKYGAADYSTVNTFEDGRGKQFLVPRYGWKFSDGVLELYGKISPTDSRTMYATFLFLTDDYIREIRAYRDSTSPHPKVDF